MSEPTINPVVEDTTFDTSTAAGRLRTLWAATADPQLAMSADEVADVATVLAEHAAMAAELAEVRAYMADPFNRHRIAVAVRRAHRQRDEAVEAANAEVEEYRAELVELRAQVAGFAEQLADAREMALDKLVEAFGEGWDNCRLHLDNEARRGRGIAVGQYSNQLPWPQYAALHQHKSVTEERA